VKAAVLVLFLAPLAVIALASWGLLLAGLVIGVTALCKGLGRRLSMPVAVRVPGAGRVTRDDQAWLQREAEAAAVHGHDDEEEDW
jgi:hypothetical protein